MEFFNWPHDNTKTFLLNEIKSWYIHIYAENYRIKSRSRP